MMIEMDVSEAQTKPFDTLVDQEEKVKRLRSCIRNHGVVIESTANLAKIHLAPMVNNVKGLSASTTIADSVAGHDSFAAVQLNARAMGAYLDLDPSAIRGQALEMLKKIKSQLICAKDIRTSLDKMAAAQGDAALPNDEEERKKTQASQIAWNDEALELLENMASAVEKLVELADYDHQDEKASTEFQKNLFTLLHGILASINPEQTS